MFLHLGADRIIREREIVGVFDIDRVSVSARGREFLKKAQRRNQLFAVSDELPKSIVVCTDGRVFISQLASATLLKRAEEGLRRESVWNRGAARPREND